MTCCGGSTAVHVHVHAASSLVLVLGGPDRRVGTRIALVELTHNGAAAAVRRRVHVLT